MDEFFAEKSANADGAHVVHTACCPSLPPKEQLHYIGVRSTKKVPLEEAAHFYSNSAPCPECMTS
jgi:hypothetical protein